jgi:hypothetical protein
MIPLLYSCCMSFYRQVTKGFNPLLAFKVISRPSYTILLLTYRTRSVEMAVLLHSTLLIFESIICFCCVFADSNLINNTAKIQNLFEICKFCSVNFMLKDFHLIELLLFESAPETMPLLLILLLF